jgi:uncharacterized protein (TIGR03118 family)
VTLRAQNPTRPALLLAALLSLLTGSLFGQHYTRTDLTADRSGISSAPNIDSNLINSWGLARSSGSPWWIADNGMGLSTLYDMNGVPQSLVVTIPPPKGQSGTSAPTGTVFNYTGAFDVAPGQSAVFIFVTEDGTISGWNPNVNATNAVLAVDNSKKGAIYKGCAIAMTSNGPRLYVSNFATAQVEIYNGNFQRVFPHEGAFTDPNLPANYAPFGLQNVGGNIIVTFAQRNPGSRDENHGAGLGFVDVFNTTGGILLRLQHGKFMNAPWGLAQAPGDFGVFSHRLLVGNFGDGTINAFNAVSGTWVGSLRNPDDSLLTIDGLWALSFAGDNTKSGLATVLYFTSGPNDESDGIFGNIAPVSSEQRGNSE